MTEDERIKEHMDRYHRALHAMQSGIAMGMDMGGSKETQPKHLRVGVNSAMVETSALVGLLIEKKIITREDWARALATGMEAEQKSYEKRLTDAVGFKVTLG